MSSRYAGALTSQHVELRRWGSVRARGNSLQMRIFSGADPVTGRELYRTITVRGTDRAAQREAQKELTRLLRQVNESQKV
jgi:integrase